MLFKQFQMNQNANQIKYGLIKTANFIIDQLNHGQKKIIFERKTIIAERFIKTLKMKFMNT